MLLKLQSAKVGKIQQEIREVSRKPQFPRQGLMALCARHERREIYYPELAFLNRVRFQKCSSGLVEHALQPALGYNPSRV